MKLLTIMSWVLVTNADVTRIDTVCNGPVINDVLYTEEILLSGLDRPYFLSTDYTTNTVYFSYSIYSNDTAFKSVKIDLNTKQLTYINDVKNGFSHCVSANGDVFIGGRDGIYKYDKVNNIAKIYTAKGVNVWTVFCKDDLYYSDSTNVYKVVDGKPSKFIEASKVKFLTIDNDDNIFYGNVSGLFRKKKDSKDIVFYKDTNAITLDGLATDLNGVVYVAATDGIYVVNKLKNDLKIYFKTTNDIFGVTFDVENNMIYSDELAVYKLRPTKYDECN